MENKLSIIIPFKGNPKKIDQFSLNHQKLLENRTNINFLIIDSSNSPSIIENNTKINYFYKPGFSLYQALNYGILKSHSLFYLAMGIDDVIFENIFLAFEKIKNSEADILTFPVKNNLNTLPFSKLRINHRNFVYQHSVSTIFRRDIHSKIGLYPTEFRISADAFIILKAYKNKLKFHKYTYPCIGEYDVNGVSSRENLIAIYELSIICLKLRFIKSSSYYFLISLLKFCLKLFKYNKY